MARLENLLRIAVTSAKSSSRGGFILKPAIRRPRRSLPRRTRGLVCLGLVYLIWGSTYLAIHYAVRGADGFPPFTLGAARLSIAGVLMVLWAALAGQRVLLGWRDYVSLASVGCMLWLGGNGLVIWAVTRVDTGYAALLMASMPIWIVVIESVLDRRAPTRATRRAIAFGTAGIAALSAPRLAGAEASIAGSAAVIIAAISWAAGSVYQQRRPSSVAPMTSAGYQLLFASLGFAVVALVRGEPMPSPNAGAWGALVYLIVIGCVVGFGGYVYALRELPAGLVMTHAYVNPVVAVLLGWLFVGEAVTLWTWLGTSLVLFGVAEVFRTRTRAH